MAFDFIDMLVDTKDEYLTGYFYKRRPRTPEDGKITFKYKQMNPNSKIFDTVLGNVRADSARYAIKTNDHCGFNIGGYIVTQNGLIWEITEVITNEQTEGRNDVLRWFKTAKNADCSIRMIQITDLFDKEEAYVDECTVSVKLDGATTDEPMYVSVTTYGEPTQTDTHTMHENETYTFSFPKGVGVRMEAASVKQGLTYGKGSVFFSSLQTVVNKINVTITLNKITGT